MKNIHYEERINALIPFAVKQANKATSKLPKRTAAHNTAWNTAFHIAMDKLTKEKGLRV